MPPPVPTRISTVFAMVCPAWKLRFDVPGRPAADGHTVRYPGCCGATTVTVASTEATPLPGIPPRPVTCTGAVPTAATAPAICRPVRESAIRAGVTDTTAPAAAGAATAAALRRCVVGDWACVAGAVTAPATNRASTESTHGHGPS